MASTFYRIQGKYPNAKIYVMDCYNYQRNNKYNPTRTGNTNASNSVMKMSIALHDVADAFGVTVIPISKCGINAVNSPQYTVETDKEGVCLHPNDDGHTLIFRQVYKALYDDYQTVY